MKKSNKKFEFKVESYGLYTRWDKKSRELPQIKKFTNNIPSEADNEFGMVLHIKRGKGINIQFRIIHPPFKNENGEIVPDFVGEHLVSSNDYYFFVGDCIWEPVEDKKGLWSIEVLHKDKLLAGIDFVVE